MTINLYSILTAYGTVYKINSQMNNVQQFVNWTENTFKYVQYNPRKDIKRYGLSITSLDGGLSGRPDLDSLPEYNRENNTLFDEKHFRTFTPVYEHEDLKQVLEPLKNNIFRSHILKLDQGGFFPPHRDIRGMNFNSFRLIIPLQNMGLPSLTFVVDNVMQNWELGCMHFVDTAKMHYLFNSSLDPSYMIVLNIDLNEDTVKYVTNNLRYR